MDFNIGDVVRLLSGGCRMTVTDANNHWVYVVYHDTEGKPHSVNYRPKVLYKVSPGDE